MRSYAEDTAAAGREILPDLTRAWALFGIAVVNVGVLSWPMMSSYHDGGLPGLADYTAFYLVCGLFLMKSYSLFSFMFGVGFAYQMQSAERRSVGFAGRYWRRILGLFLFGLFNIFCFFIGDILVIYAVLGSVLFLFRKAGAKTLLGWAIGIYAVQILFIAFMAFAIWAGVTFAPEEMAKAAGEMGELDVAAREVFTAAGFLETSIYRLSTYAENFITFLLFQGIGALGFFLFGLAAVKSGVIANPAAPIWKRARWIGLPIGLLVSGAGAWLLVHGEGMLDPSMMLGMVLIATGSPFSSFGYIGLLAKWAEGPGGPIRTFCARGGTASLTAYLMQNAILSFTFSAYGLGYFAKLPASTCILIGAVVALFSIVFTSLWRVWFARGPMEVILRNWTYLGAR
ncbi:MAG: DUF418 domain-containing protein [Hyphomonadaceae bacterium]|nr:DUF418 domain-containing protein [Hyphomonadaceae bacterium]